MSYSFARVFTSKISSWNTISILAATIITFFGGPQAFFFSHLLNKRFSEFLNYATARSFMHVYTLPPYIHLLYLCHCWAPLLLLIYSPVHPFHSSIRPPIHPSIDLFFGHWPVGGFCLNPGHTQCTRPSFLIFFFILFVKPNSAGGPVRPSSSN